jgi:hypothetical protein
MNNSINDIVNMMDSNPLMFMMFYVLFIIGSLILLMYVMLICIKVYYITKGIIVFLKNVFRKHVK